MGKGNGVMVERRSGRQRGADALFLGWLWRCIFVRGRLGRSSHMTVACTRPGRVEDDRNLSFFFFDKS